MYETNFEDSFQVGPFTKIVEVQKHGKEDSCNTTMKQMIIAAIKNMQGYMEGRALSFEYTKNQWYVFKIDLETLDILCSQRAVIKLTDDRKNILYIQKPPFVRGIQPGVGNGIFVKINAVLIHAGDPIPSTPDEYGQIFLPDTLQEEHVELTAHTSRFPKGIDGSVPVIYGIRKAVNPNFKDYTADQLFKIYSTRSDTLSAGQLIFFDYENNGTMDYVATFTGDGLMTYASSSSSIVEKRPVNYLDDEISNRGGKIYYAQLNWAKMEEEMEKE